MNDESAPQDAAGGTGTAPPGKWRSVAILLAAQVAAMSLWFVSAAVLPEMVREVSISPWR